MFNSYLFLQIKYIQQVKVLKYTKKSFGFKRKPASKFNGSLVACNVSYFANSKHQFLVKHIFPAFFCNYGQLL